MERLSPYKGSCLFAPAPDVLGDAIATIERSLPVLSQIRDLGYKAAFVAQDGLRIKDIPFDEFDCLFIGGSTSWKLSADARVIALLARGMKKWVHMGRVNSARRFLTAYKWGCDSVDGNFLKFGPHANFPRIKRWLGNNYQGIMDI
jgi:hypothetical protein